MQTNLPVKMKSMRTPPTFLKTTTFPAHLHVLLTPQAPAYTLGSGSRRNFVEETSSVRESTSVRRGYGGLPGAGGGGRGHQRLRQVQSRRQVCKHTQAVGKRQRH